jgi:hypothetical protein
VSTDRPPPDDAAERMEAIAERARRRSTQRTELADMAALEIAAFGNGDEKAISRIVRTWIDRAVDASAQWHSEELARIVNELADERKRIERLEAERDAYKRQLQAVLRARSSGR